MKVLFIHGLYHPYVNGGAEYTLKRLAEALRTEEFEPVVMSIGPHQGLVREVVNGVRVWRAGIRNLYFPDGRKSHPGWKRALWHLIDCYNPWMKSYAEQILRIENPDVACCHNLAGWSISVWDALTRHGVPFIQVLHDQYLLCPRSTMFNGTQPCARQCMSCHMLRRFHARRSRNIPAAVGVSHFILDRLTSRGYFHDTPVRTVIRNHHDLNGQCNGSQPRSKEIIFGFIGTLAPNKGIEVLLETFMRHAAPTWKLIVAGKGQENYETNLRQRYADRRIEFIGYVEPDSFYPRVDATVVPSLWEDTFPGVVLESLAFGKPVIGANRGGIPEMLRDGETGLIVDVSSPDNLATILWRFAENIEEWRARGTGIRRLAQEQGNIDEWAAQWSTIFREVAHTGRLQKCVAAD